MARSFNKTGPDFLEYGDAAVTGVPLTLAARINLASVPPTTAIPYIALSIGRSDANHRFWIDIHRTATSWYAEANSHNGTTSGVASRETSGSPTTDTWNNLVGVFSSASAREIYFDGLTSNAAPAATITPSGLNRTRIGSVITGSTYGAFDGRIADAAIWNVALTADEIAQYNLGVSPLLIRPASLVSYWPLLGRTTNEEDWVGGRLMTATNTAAYDHPRVIAPHISTRSYFGPVPTLTLTANLDAAESGGDTFAATADSNTRAATTFYIDNAGNDSNSGLSGSPWQTNTAVNAAIFIPGDKLVFTAGQSFAGPFTFTASGTAGAPIVITTSGRSTTVPSLPSGGVAQSNPATITIADGAGHGVNVLEAEYIWLDNLHVAGSGVNTTTGATTTSARGFNVRNTTTNKLRGVKLTALSVTGCKHGFLAWSPNTKKGWDALQIWGCKAYANQGWGFMTPIVWDYDGTGQPNPEGLGYTQNNDIYIGNCQVYDHPGNTAGVIQGGGIYPYNCDGGIVERCVVHDIGLAGTNTAAGSPGFHLVACNALTFQYCEAYKIHKNAAGYDGEGFDLEGNCVNCVIQYCYAHDCDSAGFLSVGHTVRYCVAYNNNVVADTWTASTSKHIYSSICHSVASSTYSDDMYVYGNTVYAPNGDAFGITHIGSNSNQTFLYNNILISKAGSKSAHIYNAELKGNVYYAIGGGTVTVYNQATTASYNSISALRTAGYETQSAVNYGVYGDPLLKNIAGASSDPILPSAAVATLDVFDLTASSPAIGAGIDYSLVSVTPGDYDFHGGPSLRGTDYDSGAHEAAFLTADLAASDSGGDTFSGTGAIGTAATLTADLAATESGADTFAGAGTYVAAGTTSANLDAAESGADTFAGTGTWAAAVVVASVTITLVNESGTAQASLSSLKWAWFDQVTPDLFSTPTDQGSAEVTDTSGILTIDLNNTALTSGDIGWLIVTNSTGSLTQSPAHRAFSGPVEVD
jgi:hypothetical protein